MKHLNAKIFRVCSLKVQKNNNRKSVSEMKNENLLNFFSLFYVLLNNEMMLKILIAYKRIA